MISTQPCAICGAVEKLTFKSGTVELESGCIPLTHGWICVRCIREANERFAMMISMHANEGA